MSVFGFHGPKIAERRHAKLTNPAKVASEISKSHRRLYRYLNDLWLFTKLMRPDLMERSEAYLASKSEKDRRYSVPRRASRLSTRRTDAEVGQIFMAQYNRGIYESNITSIVSRTEAFIQDCLFAAISVFPEKVSIIDKNGIPISLFLAHKDRETVLERFIEMRCQELMFLKPEDYTNGCYD